MKRNNWKVGPFGIRPAGSPNRCFYCGVAKGEDHHPECIIRERSVIIDVTIRMVRLMPESWTAEDIEFQLNDASWCADNILLELDNQAENRGCLCQDFKAKFIKEATAQDERDYKIFVKNCES
jgi:hypothetical protein